MRGGLKFPPTKSLGPMTVVLCPTRISEYKFSNEISIFNMSFDGKGEKFGCEMKKIQEKWKSKLMKKVLK